MPALKAGTFYICVRFAGEKANIVNDAVKTGVFFPLIVASMGVLKLVKLAGRGIDRWESVSYNGMRQPFTATSAISEAVSVPVIASGGAGTLEDLYQALVAGKADAVLAASIFHYGTYSIREIKEYLAKKGMPVRL